MTTRLGSVGSARASWTSSTLPVHPIIVGTGQRLFEDGGVQIPLTLAQSATFSTGVAQKA